MAHQVRLARGVRALAIATALTAVVGCAHTPPQRNEALDADRNAWLGAAPAAPTVVDGAEKICRKRLEIGTRIPVTRCLTPEEDLRERRRAATLLGLVGGGQFRDGS